MKYWTTKDGIKILVKDMTYSHIQNTINHLERKIASGEVFALIGGHGIDSDDMWVDEIEEFLKS